MFNPEYSWRDEESGMIERESWFKLRQIYGLTSAELENRFEYLWGWLSFFFCWSLLHWSHKYSERMTKYSLYLYRVWRKSKKGIEEEEEGGEGREQENSEDRCMDLYHICISPCICILGREDSKLWLVTFGYQSFYHSYMYMCIDTYIIKYIHGWL